MKTRRFHEIFRELEWKIPLRQLELKPWLLHETEINTYSLVKAIEVTLEVIVIISISFSRL
ncbi:hypothetical protein J5TS2_39310 [Brevibacillus halotolerans]|nr:hypothetical protein J5TS2_39310 [Brevibacillus halotolerans]